MKTIISKQFSDACLIVFKIATLNKKLISLKEMEDLEKVVFFSDLDSVIIDEIPFDRLYKELINSIQSKLIILKFELKELDPENQLDTILKNKGL